MRLTSHTNSKIENINDWKPIKFNGFEYKYISAVANGKPNHPQNEMLPQLLFDARCP